MSARRLGATFGVLAASCAGVPESSLSSHGEAVSGGEISGAVDDFVVRLRVDQPDPYEDVSCSGVLLAPNLVLTALHCVAVYDGPDEFWCRPDGSLGPGPTGGWIGETVDPGGIDVIFGTELASGVAARGTSVLGSGSTVVCVDDLAFVVLDTALPVGKIPVRLEQPVVRGERMTVIGYGQNDWRDTPRARRSDIAVLDVGPDDTADGAGTIAPRTFVLDGGPCDGDSGGPALSDESGAVAGVFSYNFAGDCTQPGTRASFAKLAPLASLLERAFEAAGQTPRIEGREEAPVAPARSRSGCTLGAGERDPARVGLMGGALAVLLVRRRRAVRYARRS
ncbi:MAG TPA: trypsin-like serine protease [Polyangiaceae bacterium]